VIGQFKFLKPLLFVHGREAYRRNSYLVCYNFYKNVLFVLPAFWFGFFSVFSGQTLYETLFYQFFNMAFTAFPIMWFATMDYQYERVELLSNTKHYEIGLKDKCFGTKVFWQWLSLGALKALMLTWICFYV
jgi:magnesium-transporting ATPase (P-type)